MDLGSPGFTQFKMDETVTAYIADNIELFDCDIQLVHSHNQMSCFFSGTDTQTLREEGNDRNCFVSLIVNNAGTYCAAVTRKIQRKTEVITKSLGTSYEFFGEGEIRTNEDPMSESTKVVDSEVIEYFMLDVERETVDNPLEYLDYRFNEIERKKEETKKVASHPTINIESPNAVDENFFSWIHSNRKQSAEAKEALYSEPTLFGEEVMNELIDASKWQPDPTIIHHLICQLLTCSLIVNKDIDLKQWVSKHMVKKYDEIFNSSYTVEFDSWADSYVEFIINHYCDEDVPAEVYDDWDAYTSKIAQALSDELEEYPNNWYIDEYSSKLNHYILIDL